MCAPTSYLNLLLRRIAIRTSRSGGLNRPALLVDTQIVGADDTESARSYPQRVADELNRRFAADVRWQS